MVIAHYRVPAGKEGLLAIAFPGWTVVREPLPIFNTDAELIVFSEARTPPYPNKRIVWVNRRGEIDLASCEGAIRIMQDRGLNVAKHREEIDNLPANELWDITKQAIVTGSLPFHKEAKGKTTFNLFQQLFEGADITVPIFKQIGVHHKVVFSSLLTMMARTKQEEFTGLSPGYAKALAKNKHHLGTFKRMCLDYMESQQTDLDFMAFLVNLGEKS